MNILAVILVICSAIEWNIKDSTVRQYVTPEELSVLVEHTNLNPEGKSPEAVMTHAIETCVQSHPMVRTAECYITTKGKVRVELTQRIPILRVKADGGNYFIDSDRLRMPAYASVTTEVIPVTGKVDESLAQTVLGDIVEWLQEHSYWENRFVRIEVKNKNDIVLVDQSGMKVKIGNGLELESQMYKLRVFEKQMKEVEGKTYKELDLRYKNQVIGKE